MKQLIIFQLFGLLTIEIIELFKGERIDKLLEYSKYSTCDIGISKGDEWIIFGEIRNGKMSVNVTSRNIKYKNNNEVRDWIYTKKDLNQVVVVQDSVAILPVIRVDIFSKEKKLSVEFIQVSGVVNTKIFEMDFSAEIPIVTLIDLRPVGYNVFGDSTALNIGEQKYQGNMFENMHSLVKLENVTN